jgi:hypothetical protein
MRDSVSGRDRNTIGHFAFERAGRWSNQGFDREQHKGSEFGRHLSLFGSFSGQAEKERPRGSGNDSR